MKNLDQLIEDLKSNEDLRTKLAAMGEDAAAVDAALEAEGYAVTAADIKAYAEQHDEGEPTDGELRQVAGGGIIKIAYSGFGCTIVGAGAGCWA